MRVRVHTVAVSLTAMLLLAGDISAQVDNPSTWPQTGIVAPFAGYYGFPAGGGQTGVLPGSIADSYQLQTTIPTGALAIPITSNKAIEIIEKYLVKTNNQDLFVDRVFEYNTHFEAELKEKETQRGAFELIIDKFNGRVYPETGPNLLWNGKYGVNANYFGIQPALTESVGDCLQLVGDFIKRTSPELKIEGDVTEYYGYYEFHVTQDGKLAIEVNVNGFTGQMWIENWHGSLLREVTLTTQKP